MRDILFSRTSWITALLLAGVLGNNLWRGIEGRSKLRAGDLEKPGASENITVILSVRPEPFHMSRLQEWGTMVGAEGRTVRLRSVNPTNLERIASRSWVEALQPLVAP